MAISSGQDDAEASLPFRSVPYIPMDEFEIRSPRQPTVRDPLKLPMCSVGHGGDHRTGKELPGGATGE